jgi:hypothetical protein
MDDRDHATPPSSRTDAEGVRMSGRAGAGRRPALFYKTLALVLVAGCAVYLVTTLHGGSAPTADAADADARIASARATDAPPQASFAAARGREVTPRPPAAGRGPDGGPGGDLGQALAAFVAPGEEPTMTEVIDELHKAGIHTGLGAFNPPGTSPPLVGLAVPEDYPLPEGYVRHFQATDDGQRIEPILMYSPDFEFFDAAGRRIPIPANRVVPSNMAPPGLAIRLIDIPPPLEPPGPSL